MLLAWLGAEEQKRQTCTLQVDQAKAIARAFAGEWVEALRKNNLSELRAKARIVESLIASTLVVDKDGGVLFDGNEKGDNPKVTDVPKDVGGAGSRSRNGESVVWFPVVDAGMFLGWVRLRISHRMAEQHASASISRGAIYALVLIVTGGSVSLLLGARTTRGLHDITKAIEARKAGGGGARASLGGSDDIGQIGKLFDEQLECNDTHRLHLRNESALRTSAEEELRLRSAALESVANMVLLTDRSGKIVWCNRAFIETTGYRADEVIGKNPGSVVGSGQHPPEFFRDMWETILGGKVWRGEMTNRRKNGHLYVEDITITPLVGDTNQITHFVALKQDITEKRASTQALASSEERFRQVVESINEGFWMSDATWSNLLYVSPACERIWGISCDHLRGPTETIRKTIHPEDRARLSDLYAKQGASGFDEVIRIIRPDGVVRWLRWRSFLVRNEQGEVQRLTGVVDDVTEGKSLEAQFLRSQRTEAIGTLANGIAHDLNNILSPILIATGLLREALTTPEDRELVALLEKSASRGAAIVRQLLTFSRGMEGARVSIQIRHLLKEMSQMMHETFPRNITFRIEVEEGLWTILADVTQIHQVLLNLCVNARDAMPDGGEILLRCRNLLVEEGGGGLPSLSNGRYLHLCVKDTGCGIPLSIQQRVFDPFFTTKAIGKGSGLGLSTVMGIVRNHRGVITVESEEGKGASFDIYLPAETEPSSAVVSDEPSVLPRGEGELLLVVDDEPNVLASLEMILVAQGFRVLTASSGNQAMGHLQSHRGDIRLLLTDMMMPGLSGIDLLKEARSWLPELPIVAMSGLDLASWEKDLERFSGVHFLGKPHDASALLISLKEALAAPRASQPS
jgi:PAS domain S-box-containing protein